MKLPSFLFFAFVALVSFAGALPEAEAEADPDTVGIVSGARAAVCKAKNNDAYHAINKFCNGKTGIMVPSAYAKKEKYHGNAFVKIGGESFCNPPQWVPRKWCLTQFYKVCANKKWGKGHFGRNKCQSFHIGKVTLAVPGKRDVEEVEKGWEDED